MRGLRDRLEDIRAAASDILAFVAGLDEPAFSALAEADRRTFRAVRNAPVEIGEAVKRLPPEATAAHPTVDWRGFAALRDSVEHQYFGVELPRLWPTVHEELPALLAAVEAELARLGPDG